MKQEINIKLVTVTAKCRTKFSPVGRCVKSITNGVSSLFSLFLSISWVSFRPKCFPENLTIFTSQKKANTYDMGH